MVEGSTGVPPVIMAETAMPLQSPMIETFRMENPHHPSLSSQIPSRQPAICDLWRATHASPLRVAGHSSLITPHSSLLAADCPLPAAFCHPGPRMKRGESVAGISCRQYTGETIRDIPGRGPLMPTAPRSTLHAFCLLLSAFLTATGNGTSDKLAS